MSDLVSYISSSTVLDSIHGGQLIIVDSSADITIPANKYSIDEKIRIFRNTADIVTIKAGSGVTLIPGGGTIERHAVLEQIELNTWIFCTQ